MTATRETLKKFRNFADLARNGVDNCPECRGRLVRLIHGQPAPLSNLGDDTPDANSGAHPTCWTSPRGLGREINQLTAAEAVRSRSRTPRSEGRTVRVPGSRSSVQLGCPGRAFVPCRGGDSSEHLRTRRRKPHRCLRSTRQDPPRNTESSRRRRHLLASRSDHGRRNRGHGQPIPGRYSSTSFSPAPTV